MPCSLPKSSKSFVKRCFEPVKTFSGLPKAPILTFGIWKTRDVSLQERSDSGLMGRTWLNAYCYRYQFHQKSMLEGPKPIVENTVKLSGTTLPETNNSHLKMDGWKMNFLLGWLIFRCYVSFRECNFAHFPLLGSLPSLHKRKRRS